MSKKVLLKAGAGEMTIYEDGTYCCSHWKDDDYSEWRLHEGIWEYRHDSSAGWNRRDNGETRNMATQIQRILDDIFEKEVLGV